MQYSDVCSENMQQYYRRIVSMNCGMLINVIHTRRVHTFDSLETLLSVRRFTRETNGLSFPLHAIKIYF